MSADLVVTNRVNTCDLLSPLNVNVLEKKPSEYLPPEAELLTRWYLPECSALA
jgi:hypothetical protein